MSERAVIIGGGMGGLVSAALLAANGLDVTLLEASDRVGGKARRVLVDGVEIDAGPTVFTMKDVFEDIFASCGGDLHGAVRVRQADRIARHAWDENGHLDLYADEDDSADAIHAFAGDREARAFRSFCAEARRMHETLDEPMMRSDQPGSPLALMARIGPRRLAGLGLVRPYQKLWSVMNRTFADPRLAQLFARYSTYSGSSPLLAPATLMLIADVEAKGVWLIDGGIAALARALADLAEANGAKIRLESPAARIETDGSRATAVILEDGERLPADRIVMNGDPAALAAGLLGDGARAATRPMQPKDRSLSALVWKAHAKTAGFPLARHNVFFSPDYEREFTDIAGGAPPADPSVYICAQDRERPGPEPAGRERLHIIVNAPASPDIFPEETDQWTAAMEASLNRCGLTLEPDFPRSIDTPRHFAKAYPATGGAIYGPALHDWAASFRRQSARTRIPGLYCAGGATHPGAGVPMAALSGSLAASAILSDRASMPRSRRAAMPGGMSTRSARTGATA